MSTGSEPPEGTGVTAAGRTSAAGQPGADAFDLWLRRSLRETFGGATDPVPADILRLIEEDRAERERIRQGRWAKRAG